MTRREAIYAALSQLQHPDRLLVLERCAMGPTSPKTICEHLADQVDFEGAHALHERRQWIKSRLGSVAYHTRTALEQGTIEPHSKRQIRGAVQHLYVISAKGLALLDSLDLHDETLRETSADAGEASAQAAFWRTRAIELGAKRGEYQRHLKKLEKAALEDQ